MILPDKSQQAQHAEFLGQFTAVPPVFEWGGWWGGPPLLENPPHKPPCSVRGERFQGWGWSPQHTRAVFLRAPSHGRHGSMKRLWRLLDVLPRQEGSVVTEDSSPVLLTSVSPVHELQDHQERVPDVPPRTKAVCQPSPVPALPRRTVPLPPPITRSASTESPEDYEDPDPALSPVFESVDMADKDGLLHVPRAEQRRFNSLCSDDELLDDEGEGHYQSVTSNIYLPAVGRVPSHVPRDDPTPHLTPVIKMGWLDKNPPQGSLIYQKRWVKLDADYLRYFDSDKDVYSKRIIPTSSITSITNVGDQKFEVVTHNRTFLFRAESDCRNLMLRQAEQSSSFPVFLQKTAPAPFVAESDQLKEEWVEAMRESIGEALSNYEVAKRIWSEESNQFCADCRAAKPEWAAINLCVVFCKRCAGEHRGLGPSISKVRSLKMDKKVWTDELIQVFQLLGNERANLFWAANVPPSEALTASSCSEERRRFIAAKYREGKYRRYHQLFGNQQELDN
ncbi:hypothetical protein JZ751_005436, partial [Albula glossodonta]